ncbi:transcriptional coactivator p15 (PC4) [Rhodovulum imhoffii]|uniref:Transcriptional coactivator p15 (PC4) n=1 Tax=Rhodovulum imhoffii TaxID=365340 RepID=A0A2T5BP28_9RHOB|nr:hypothetical protein [Rhodovulum imhoffii]PTN00742.1 transcriptional coactivator p15 (PC4) [Rhodovulum imhoffii]
MTIIAAIPKNSREEYRITRETFRGHNLAQIRVWFRADDGEFRPSSKGVAIRVENLPQVIDGLRSALGSEHGSG